MRFWVVTFGVLLLSCIGCSKPDLQKAEFPITTAPTVELAVITCDETLWAPTYSRDRLKVFSPCEKEIGVVKFVELEYDGDLVIDIKPSTDRLLTSGNKDVDAAGCGPTGCLHIEVPCQGSINARVQPDADGTCNSFMGAKIAPPLIGDIIEVAGHWVADMRHGGWAEIHGAVVRVLFH